MLFFRAYFLIMVKSYDVYVNIVVQCSMLTYKIKLVWILFKCMLQFGTVTV